MPSQELRVVKRLKDRQRDFIEVWNELRSGGEWSSGEDDLAFREFAAKILDALMLCLESTPDETGRNPQKEALQNIVQEFIQHQLAEGYTFTDILAFFRAFKEALVRMYEDTKRLVTREFVREWLRIDQVMDEVVCMVFEASNKDKQEVIERQSRDIEELSTPVIQVWDGVLTMPIIGTLDSSRTEKVMENLLQSIVDTGSKIAILDISGVPTVDTMVAQHLMKTVKAAKLMGAECIISGIRPEIAQTIVQLGIDLSHVHTKATLSEALKLAMKTLGYGMSKLEEQQIGEEHGPDSCVKSE